MSAADRKDKPLIVLHLEDDPLDAQLVFREFDTGLPGSQWRHVISESQYRQALADITPDIILADYNLPDFDGLSALAIARDLRPQIPFIFVSGALGEEVAIETLKSGATDYVLKNRLRRLVPAVKRAIAEAYEREERRRLEEELSEISNREQRRIGSDLHDGLGQELTGLSLLLRSIETQAERDAPNLVPHVARSREVLAQAIESTRKLARGLSPVNLERGGLAAAIENLTRQYAGTGLACEFRSNLKLDGPLDETPATHLYRIAQEAISNAAKHAQAHHIRVALATQNGGLLLTVEDDGRGIPPELMQQPTGMGLRLMEYRARIIGGELAVVVGNKDTQGTSVSCFCPLSPNGQFIKPTTVTPKREPSAPLL